MKKLSFLIGALILTSSVFAQRPTDGTPFSLEGGLNFNSGSAQTLTAPMLRFRYFVGENISARVGVGISTSKTLDNYYGTDINGFDSKDSLGTDLNKSSMMTFSIGGAYHFSQSERLSPYGYADFLIGMGSSSNEMSNYDGATYMKGANSTTTSSSSMIGVNFGAGFDYYFAENVYFGAELGFMLSSFSDKGGESTSGTVTITNLPSGDASSFMTGTAGLRLGWRF